MSRRRQLLQLVPQRLSLPLLCKELTWSARRTKTVWLPLELGLLVSLHVSIFFASGQQQLALRREQLTLGSLLRDLQQMLSVIQIKTVSSLSVPRCWDYLSVSTLSAKRLPQLQTLELRQLSRLLRSPAISSARQTEIVSQQLARMLWGSLLV